MSFPLIQIAENDQSELDLRWSEKWLAVDLDGTLCTYNGFNGFDVFGDIVQPIFDAVTERHIAGWYIAIYTARADTVEHAELVEKFLNSCGVPYNLITNIKKPYFREFWDDRASPVVRNEGKFLDTTQNCISGVVSNLQEAAQIFTKRNADYGDAYKSIHPAVMESLFPSGIGLSSQDDHCRFGLFAAMVAKIARYSANFSNGGHSDSLTDLMAFAAMLKDVDDENSKR